MSERTVEFLGRTHKGTRGNTVTVNLGRVKNTKLRQSMVKTDVGHIDVTVSLDRWGRLHAVLVEATRNV